VDRMAVVFLVILIAFAALILGGVFSEPITAFIRRRLPDFSYEGETFMLAGLYTLAAFVIGLLVMYLLAKP
jgi:hypothetical protein